MLNIRLWFSGQLVTLENPTSPYFLPSTWCIRVVIVDPQWQVSISKIPKHSIIHQPDVVGPMILFLFCFLTPLHFSTHVPRIGWWSWVLAMFFWFCWWLSHYCDVMIAMPRKIATPREFHVYLSQSRILCLIVNSCRVSIQILTVVQFTLLLWNTALLW